MENTFNDLPYLSFALSCHRMHRAGSGFSRYSYNWDTGQYERYFPATGKSEVAGYSEVFNNFIRPNSTDITSAVMNQINSGSTDITIFMGNNNILVANTQEFNAAVENYISGIKDNTGFLNGFIHGMQHGYGMMWDGPAGGNIISNWWNTHWTDRFIPDVVYFNMGAVGLIILGVGYNSGYALQIRGKEGFGIRPYDAVATKYGIHGAIGFSFGYSSYSGDSRNFSFYESFYGSGTNGYEIDYIIGIGAFQSPNPE